VNLAATPRPREQVEMQVRDECDVAGVIAGIGRFCAHHAFSEVFTAHIATAASELANNLWMYARHGGEVRLTLLEAAPQRGVELVSQDDGPGIADVALALTEGYSTAGGMGCGLPGVRRLMDEFEIDSRPGQGTRIVARKWTRALR
jgi:serine/threonine-protein kinase RsbT